LFSDHIYFSKLTILGLFYYAASPKPHKNNMNSDKSKPKLLIAPLDWGLGHATRCIPIIQELLRQNCEVLLAGEGKTAFILREAFPHLPLLHLQGYDIKYGRNKWELIGKMLFQVPNILAKIDDENEWLRDAIEEHNIDAVISDNRYGLYNEKLISVFITHQLFIQTSIASIADNLLQKLNYQFVDEYNECWVPDFPSIPNLGGDLSHPIVLPKVPVKYLGPLSRFTKENHYTEGDKVLIILSGPEPQRTIFENIVLQQLINFSTPVILIRGLPGETNVPHLSGNITVYNHLPAKELELQIKNAAYIISRSGYSTIMDLISLGKKTILIPTPGQTEQEYLAEYLMKNRMAFCIKQDKFKLKNVLDLAASFDYLIPELPKVNYMQNAIAELIAKIKMH
jgi:uncharacterized protein (TIGR00661 family)